MNSLKRLAYLPWLALALTISPSAKAGWENGNAGDTFTAEFILTARDVIQRMKLLPQSELGEINLDHLSGAVANTKVHSEETLNLNGYEVDAINYPDQKKIVISRSRWRALRVPSETTQRLMVVLHEYLFITGIPDPQFTVSGRLIPQLAVKDFNPNRWWSPLNPTNRISTELVYTQNDCKLPGIDLDIAQTEQNVSVAATGDCGDAFRKVTILKNSFTAPPASGARGTFHRFDILVEGPGGNPLGSFTYEPEWGQCLLPQDGTCRLSGKIFVGGVQFLFWLVR